MFRAKISDEREVGGWRFVKILTLLYRLLLLSLKSFLSRRTG